MGGKQKKKTAKTITAAPVAAVAASREYRFGAPGREGVEVKKMVWAWGGTR